MGFVKAQYGFLSLDSYKKINSAVDGNYVFYPFQSAENNVYGVYIAPVKEMPVTERSSKIWTRKYFTDVSLPARVDTTSIIPAWLKAKAPTRLLQVY